MTMQVSIKATSDGVGYASKNDYEYEGKNYEADIQNGDTVTITNAGSLEEGTFGPQHYFNIKTRNGDKKAAFNQTSINVLAQAWGTETEDWVGKTVHVLTKKGVFAGKKGIAAYFVVDGYYLDDFGDLTNEKEGGMSEPVFTTKTANQQAVEDLRNAPVEEPEI